MTECTLTNSEVNRAGRTLVAAHIAAMTDGYPLMGRRSKFRPGSNEIEAYLVFQTFRRRWTLPPHHLTQVANKLRRITNGMPEVQVTQRMKGEQRIIRKLANSSTRLTQLQDIGGCRVIVPRLLGLRRVQRLAEALWPNAKLHDRIRSPSREGYRAVHLVVEPAPRVWVEIQLRTALQHEWAMMVESEEQHYGQAYKWGQGDPDVLRKMRFIADTFARWDAPLGEQLALPLAMPRGSE